MGKKLGIIGAMPLEIDAYRAFLTGAREETVCGNRFLVGRIADVPVVLTVSGVGKVNAAFSAAVTIFRFGAEELVNTGVAGGIGLKPLDLVIADRCCQHDVDTSALGDPPGYLSGGGLDRVFLETDRAMLRAFRNILPDAVVGTIATGDRFVADAETNRRIGATFGAIAADCESCAVLQTAVRAGVPAAVIRSISDGADETGAASFRELAGKAAERAASAVARYCGTRGY